MRYLCPHNLQDTDMDNCKELIYTGVDGGNSLRLQVEYENISEQERCRLRHKRLHEVDEEDLEAWLAVDLEDNKWEYEYSISEDGELIEGQRVLASPQGLEAHLRYQRAEYQHAKSFAQWSKEGLNPLVKELTTMAEQDPQYDWHYLYKLERQKLICMEAYLSHSRVADKEGNYTGKHWLKLCIRLLGYILDEASITPMQLRRLNTRNSINLLSPSYRVLLQETDEYDDKAEDDDYTLRSYYLRELYQLKAERLYYRIRLEYTRMWWE